MSPFLVLFKNKNRSKVSLSNFNIELTSGSFMTLENFIPFRSLNNENENQFRKKYITQVFKLECIFASKFFQSTTFDLLFTLLATVHVVAFQLIG